MSHIRVRELAGELGVSAQDVLSCLQAEGRKVRGPSTVLAESVAAGVRRSFRRAHQAARRATRPAETRADQAPPVRTPSARPAAALPPRPATGQGGPGSRSFGYPPVRRVPAPPAVSPGLSAAPAAFSAAHPFLEPGTAAAFSAAPAVAPAALRLPSRPRPTVVPEQRSAPATVAAPPAPVALVDSAADDAARRDQTWRNRGLSEQDQRTWMEAGLRSDESSLADRCVTADISPCDLKVRLSGRTALQRLRDGESVTSVWARIQEVGQQQPRTGTRLTGRFRQR